MLKIRLRRIGRTHEPFYRIVVTDEKSPVQGKFIAQIGHYNPKTKELTIQKDNASDWMNKGAKPSNTVAKLMKKEKMTHKSIVVVQTKKTVKKEEAKAEEVKAAPKSEEVTEEVTETPEVEETATTEEAKAE